MLEKLFLIKYVISTMFDDDELKSVIAVSLIIHITAMIVSNHINIVSDFELWRITNNIADVFFIIVPCAIALRSIWAFFNMNELFSKEELEENLQSLVG